MMLEAKSTSSVCVIVEGESLTKAEHVRLAEFAVNHMVEDEQDIREAAEGDEEILALLDKATKVEVLWPAMPDQAPWEIVSLMH